MRGKMWYDVADEGEGRRQMKDGGGDEGSGHGDSGQVAEGDEDGQGDEQLDHRLQDRVVEQLVIESKLLADLRENLDMFVNKEYF